MLVRCSGDPQQVHECRRASHLQDTDLYSVELGFLLGKRYDEPGGRQTTNAYDSIRPLGNSPL